MLETPVHQLADFYRSFTYEDIAQLGKIYADDVQFIDPVHKMNSLNELSDYFASLVKNVKSCQFIVSEPQIMASSENQAILTWEMIFAHPKLGNGKEVSVEGISHLKWDEKITYHRDYYDLGAMIYEHVPMMGYVVGVLKKRLAA